MFVPLWVLLPALIVLALLVGAALLKWDEQQSDESVGSFEDWVERPESEYIPPDETDLE